MPDTVNEVQVAFSANVKDLIQQLKNLSGNIDNTIAQLSEMETATDDLAESEEGLAEKSKTVTAGQKNMTGEMAKAAKETDTASAKTEKYTGVLGKLDEKTQGLKSVFTDVIGVLGMFGVSIGVTELLGKIKELADEAKRAYDNLQDIQQTTSYKYALTATQTQLAANMGQTTAMTYSIDQKTAESIYGALLNVYPELEKDTAQLQKLADTFASVSAIEGMSDMSSFMTDVFTTAAKYDIKDGEGIIKFVTDLEAASQLSAGMGGSAQQFLNVIKNADKSAQYMGMTLEDTIAYLGSSYRAGNGEDAAKMMSSMESYVLKLWSDVLTQMGEQGIDTTQLQSTGAMQKWWNSILEGMPDTIDETEIYNYFVTQGLKSASAQEIAKGIAASGGTEQFKVLMTDTITNLYQESLSGYRATTLTATDYAKSSQIAQEALKADIYGTFGKTIVNQDELNAMKDLSWLLAENVKQVYGYETASQFYGKIWEAKSADYDESVELYQSTIAEMKKLLERQNSIEPQQIQVNVQVTTDTSYAKANADVRTANGNASSLTTS